MSKKVFKVTIEEHMSETFDIEANSIEEAMEIATGQYYNEEIVLAPGECTNRLMMVEDEENDECTEWMEF